MQLLRALRKRSLTWVTGLVLASLIIPQFVRGQALTSKMRLMIQEDLQTNTAKQITAAKLRSVLAASADAIDSSLAANKYLANQIFATFSLADNIGEYNAATGVAKVTATGATSTPTTTPAFATGKFFDVTVAGTQSITGVSVSMAAGGKIIVRGTAWGYIPPSDAAMAKALALEKGAEMKNPFVITNGRLRKSAAPLGVVEFGTTAKTTEILAIPYDRKILIENIYAYTGTSYGVMFYDSVGTKILPSTYNGANGSYLLDSTVFPSNARYFRACAPLAAATKLYSLNAQLLSYQTLKDKLKSQVDGIYRQIVETGTFTHPIIWKEENQRYVVTDNSFQQSNTIDSYTVIVTKSDTLIKKSTGTSTAGVIFYDENWSYISGEADNGFQGDVKKVLVPSGACYARVCWPRAVTYDGIVIKKVRGLAKASVLPPGSGIGIVYKWSENTVTALSNCKVLVDVNVNLSGSSLTLNNITLLFDPGKKITNGTLTGWYNVSADDHQQLFDTTAVMGGNWTNHHISVKWFGASGRSAYLPTASYTSLYGQGTDDAPYINYVLRMVKGRSVMSNIYAPEGCYWVRNKIPYALQQKYYAGKLVGGVLDGTGAPALENGDVCAIYLYDNTRLYGAGDATKFLLVDYVQASDYSSTAPIYKTKVMFGWARWEQDEFTSPNWATVSATTWKWLKLGRNRTIVEGFLVNARCSYDPVTSGDTQSSGKISRIGMFFVNGSNTNAPFPTLARGQQNSVINITFEDCNMAMSYKNSYDTNKSVKSNTILNCRANNGNNKAYEFSAADDIHLFDSFASNFDCAAQYIRNSVGGSIRHLVASNVAQGINLTTSNSYQKIYNCVINATAYGIRYRNDDDGATPGLFTEGTNVYDNEFYAPIPLIFTGGSAVDDSTSTAFKEYRNLTFTNNVFAGSKAYIGYSANATEGAYNSLKISGLRFSSNTWKVDSVQIIQNVKKRGNRPQSVVKDVVFSDHIPATVQVNVIGTPDFLSFKNFTLLGQLNASSTARIKMVLDNVDVQGKLTVPAGKLIITNSTKTSGANVLITTSDVTGALTSY